MKALGIGIGFEVKRLNFQICQHLTANNGTISTTTLEVDGQSAEDWTFEETLLDNHCIAVALKSSASVSCNLYYFVTGFNSMT